MDQDKVNPFVGNTEAPAGGAPVSDASASSSSTAASGSTPSVPVNPYAPAGAPYAPGSNTPAPDFATPYSGGTYDSPDTTFSNDPAVPNTGAYTSFSPAPSQDSVQFSNVGPEKPKLFTKKFIIFAIIGLVLIAGAVVAGVLIQNNKKGGARNTSNATTVKDPKITVQNTSSPLETVARISNLLINGTDSDSTPDFNTEQWYISTIADSEADEDIILKYEDAQKASKYFNSLESQTKDNKSEELSSLMGELKENLATYQNYLSIDYYEEKLTDAYLTKGTNEATNYANSLFGGSDNNDASVLNILKRHYLDFLLGRVSLLDTYAKNGCISDAKINQDCASKFTATFTELKSQKLVAQNYVIPIFDSIKTELAQIYGILGGGNA